MSKMKIRIRKRIKSTSKIKRRIVSSYSYS